MNEDNYGKTLSDLFAQGLGAWATWKAANNPATPAPASAPASAPAAAVGFNWKPWAIGGGVVFALVVGLFLVFRKR